MTWTRRGLVVLIVAAAMSGAGCATSGPSATELLSNRRLVNRAAFDLDCPTQPLDIISIDKGTRAVSGCGRQATYVEICDGPWDNPYRTCTWLKNGDGRGGRPAALLARLTPVFA
jgi:hypothetical protein